MELLNLIAILTELKWQMNQVTENVPILNGTFIEMELALASS
jgi:hypothetical protein